MSWYLVTNHVWIEVKTSCWCNDGKSKDDLQSKQVFFLLFCLLYCLKEFLSLYFVKEKKKICSEFLFLLSCGNTSGSSKELEKNCGSNISHSPKLPCIFLLNNLIMNSRFLSRIEIKMEYCNSFSINSLVVQKFNQYAAMLLTIYSRMDSE